MIQHAETEQAPSSRRYDSEPPGSGTPERTEAMVERLREQVEKYVARRLSLRPAER